MGATVVLKSKKPSAPFVTPLCHGGNCFQGTTQASISFDLTSWTAGGGFGLYDMEKTPSWQEKEVKDYLTKTSLPANGTFNRLGRAYPDISAVGHSCPLYMSGSLIAEDGTSCSAPLIAGIVAILNDHQYKAGRPKLGFLNPLLYKMAADNPNTFTDITQGHNWCTEFQCCNSFFGFNATKGYDPVFTLGTPNVNAMLAWFEKKNIN